MNRFGFVVIPLEDGGYYCHSAAGAERGYISRHKSADDIYNNRDSIPPAVFYTTAAARDLEMDGWAKLHPNVMLAPFEIKEALKYPASAEPARFDISAKGVLPA